jgi:plasmid stabilization system protein ParE
MKVLTIALSALLLIGCVAQEDIKQVAGDASGAGTGHADQTHPTVGDKLHSVGDAIVERLRRASESVTGAVAKEGISAPKEGAGNLMNLGSEQHSRVARQGTGTGEAGEGERMGEVRPRRDTDTLSPTESVADKVSRKVKEGIENAKDGGDRLSEKAENVKEAALSRRKRDSDEDSLGKKIDRAGDAIQRKAENVADAAQSRRKRDETIGDKIADTAKEGVDKANRAGSALGRKAENMADAAQSRRKRDETVGDKIADTAKDGVDKANRAGSAIGRKAENMADAVQSRRKREETIGDKIADTAKEGVDKANRAGSALGRKAENVADAAQSRRKREETIGDKIADTAKDGVDKANRAGSAIGKYWT